MSVTQAPFGKLPDGSPVELYTLTNNRLVTVKVMTYGGIVTSIRVPDREGKPGEVQLGFDTLEDYLNGHPYFGAICGRVANRIANGRFMVEGEPYRVATNNGPNHLHGGEKGFDKALWRAQPLKEANRVGVVLKHVSPDGDEGYPGKLSVTVVYSLNDENELTIEYVAQTDRATPINLTNHTYWNLDDGGRGDVLSESLLIHADRYLPVGPSMIPTGELKAVQGTPMDFTRLTTLGARIAEIQGDPGGYDHCYVLNKRAGEDLSLAAKLVAARSGRVMEVYTTEPAIQLYTGNFLDGSLKSRGATFGQRHAVCLEAQHYPDSINQPAFPSTLLRPGETYRQTTIYKFSVEAD